MVTLTAIGHLGRDAVVNDVNGKKVINFSVAHSTKYKNSEGQEINSTFWIECAYWIDRTAIAQYLKQGTQVYVVGIPSVETYKNKDGIQVAKQRLKVSSIELLGSKKESNATPDSVASHSDSITPTGDDLPF